MFQNFEPRTASRAAWAAIMLIALATAPVYGEGDEPSAGSGGDDESMSLHGDQEGTVLKSLTIEGEDKIQIEFDRPQLNLDIDGYGVGGLVWGKTMDVVQRQEVDGFGPMVRNSREMQSPSLGRPWLRSFRSGSVARFRPKMDGVEKWQLMIADSRGDTVRVFTGKGKLPKEISWDGVYSSGELASPGLTYSYVLEAADKAGNRRNFVGPGFEVAPYRISRPGSYHLVMSGESLLGSGAAQRGPSQDDPWLLEASSWINQYARADSPIEVRVSAQNYEMAEAMGEIVRQTFARHLPGPEARVRVITESSSDAPKRGVVKMSVQG